MLNTSRVANELFDFGFIANWDITNNQKETIITLNDGRIVYAADNGSGFKYTVLDSGSNKLTAGSSNDIDAFADTICNL